MRSNHAIRRPSPETAPRRTPSRANRRRGITLFETALATVIVGLTVLSIVRLITAVTQQSFYAQKTTTGMMLANNLRELFATLPFNDPIYGTHLGPSPGETTLASFDDVEDFNGFVANPPVDGNRQALSSLANWQQSVTVTHVSPSNYKLSDPVPNDTACVLDRVTITTSFNPNPSNANGWIPVASMEFLKSKY